MSFVHTHLHTDRSQPMDGFSSPEAVAKKVKELGQPGFFITDHGTTSGLMAGYNAAKKEGLKFGFGEEFYFVPDVTIKERGYYHLVLLAKNNIGYYNLLKLTTEAHKEENFYYKPRIDWEMLEKYLEGLICTSACISGLLSISHKELIGNAIHGEMREINDAEKWLPKFKRLFGMDFYCEIHTYSAPEQKEFNIKAVELATKYDIPLLAAVDSHYVNKEDAATHRKWLKIGDDDESGYYQTDDFYIMSEEEVYGQLILSVDNSAVDSAITNTVKILDQCNVELDFKTKHYPLFPIDNQKEFLRNLVWDGFNKKFGPLYENYDGYAERVEYELEVLEKADYINYFLITWDILNWCHTNGIYTGVGRGSITASLVAYLIGITKIDPIKYGLIFERFAHLERVTPPDIDVDVEQGRRGEVIDYIRSKYGDVYQVRTFGFMEDKGARKRGGQALGFDAQDVNLINAGKKPCPKELQDLADKFKGVLQNYSVHASAVVVFPGDPCNFCAIERAKEDTYVAAYDFHDLEALGVLKQDILGLKTCDVIHNTCKLAGIETDFVDNHLPEKDEETFKMLRDGHTSGCFQIESFGMTQTIYGIKPREFRDLIPLVAIYRPGPKDAILPDEGITMLDVYLLCRNGQREVVYLHPKLEPILGPTYGVILYQEQILAIARDLCGYTLGQADVLRRIIGRKEKEKMDAAISEFVQRGEANGIDGQTIRKIADQIVTFALYGFNQGHSTAYGYIAYQTAWLKCHYPLEFMCALINSEGGVQEKIIPYIDECRRLGIKILPPNIVKSKPEWSIEDGCLRVGLTYIKNVGHIELVNPTENFPLFMENNGKLNKRIIECLIKAGAFGRYSRGLAIEQLKWYKVDLVRQKECEYKIAHGAKKDYWERQLDLIPEMPTEPQQEGWNDIDGEVEVLGFSFQDKLDHYDCTWTKPYRKDSALVQIILAEPTNVKPWKTKKDKPMAFVTLRTKEGKHDFVLFERAIKLRGLPSVGEVYVLSVENTVNYKGEPSCIITDFEAAEPIF
jgi:DNA polymerase-3 subunit alpha